MNKEINVIFSPDIWGVSICLQNLIARMDEASCPALPIQPSTEKRTDSFREALIDGIQCH
jgi:hypothetical protein